MSRLQSPQLVRALELSRELLGAADRGDGEAVGEIDALRLEHLKSALPCGAAPDAEETRLLTEIAVLNDRAIGQMEHHRRIKGRQLDVAATGRRAMNAYGNTRQLR